MGPTATRAIGPNLRVLVRGKRRSLNDIIIVTEIVKGSVAVPKHFQVDGCVANVFAVGFDSRAGFRGFDQDVVCDGSMRAPFHAGRDCLAASEEAGESCAAGKNEVLRFHSAIGVFRHSEPICRRSALSDAFARPELQPSDLGNSLQFARILKWSKYGDFQMKVELTRSAVFSSNKTEKSQLRPFTATEFAAKMKNE
jgi:hypothetical protein